MATKFIEMSSEIGFLVIDDSASFRELLSHILKKLGYRNIFNSVSGIYALNILRTEEISFIICDRNLPQLSGMEFLKEIRETPEFGRVPFMMMANEIPKDDVLLAGEFGVDGYLKKPFVIKDVSAKLSACMQKFTDPSNPELAFDAAREAFLKGDYKNSLVLYEKVMEAMPKSARVRVGMSRCLRAQNRLAEAEVQLTAAIKCNPLYVHAHHDLGLIYLQQDKMEQAVKSFDEAINLSPLNPIRYEAVADILIRAEKFAAAEIYLFRAVKLEMAYPLLYAQLGKVLFSQRKLDKAVQYFEKALKEQPQNTSFMNSMGICKKDMKRFDEALSYYNKAITIRPNDTKILFNKALCLISMKEYERAEKTLKQILKIDPGYEKAAAKLKELPKIIELVKAAALKTAS